MFAGLINDLCCTDNSPLVMRVGLGWDEMAEEEGREGGGGGKG